MFEHSDFDVYTVDDIPLGTDLFLRDEAFMQDWEIANLRCFDGGEYEQVGYVSFVAAEAIHEGGVELSWYPNIFDRYHRLTVFLPRNRIRACVGSNRWDEKPSIFVESEWIWDIHIRANCVFGLIDAIGVRERVLSGSDLHQGLPVLRQKIDLIAEKHPQVSFISFADSLILKSHWTSGYFLEDVKYTYNPESLILIFGELQNVFQEVMGLEIYGVFTQGPNEYGHDSELHVSESRNHVCLNSLGAPFADLKSIEESARKAIREGRHPPSELYLDERFLHSLKTRSRRYDAYPYLSMLTRSTCEYACATFAQIASDLEDANR